MHHVTSAKAGGQQAGDCQRSTGMTENKWYLVNKLNYYFNSCSLIQFAGRRVLHKGAKEWRNDSKEGGEKKRRAWACTFSHHHSIPRCLWLHWMKVTALTIETISQDHVLLSLDSKASFCISPKRIKVVLNWVQAGPPGRLSAVAQTEWK